MNVLFAGGAGYYPEFSGGVQASTDHLAKELQARGHRAAVLAALFGDGVFGFTTRVRLKLSRQPAVIDGFPGYPVIRTWFPWQGVPFAVRAFRPDVAVVQCHNSVPIGKALLAQDVPVVVYLRNMEFEELAGDLSELQPALYIANSQFTARAYAEKFGIEATVIPPTIDPARYATPTTGEHVTFINPYPEKGFELAVRIAARCPDIPFLFVESWKLDDDHLARIRQAIAPHGNIRLERRTSDMKTVYGRTGILLAPSQWEEAWGRVASEAHCSGIPVVGSRRGGLPEAIGEGGVVLDHDAPLDAWVGAVRRLWDDAGEYERLSAAARRFSRRPQMDPQRQFQAFLAIVEKAARSGALKAA